MSQAKPRAEPPKAEKPQGRFALFWVSDIGKIRDLVREALADIEARGLQRPVDVVYSIVANTVQLGQMTLIVIVDRGTVNASGARAAGLLGLRLKEGDLGEQIAYVSIGYVRRGYAPGKVLKACVPAVDAWGQQHGCDLIQFETRRTAWGMQRLLKGTGFYEARAVFERVCGHGQHVQKQTIDKPA